MASTEKAPESVELWDGDRIRAWQDYHLSGAADLISSVNLAHALLALADSGLLARLSAEEPRPATELLAGFDEETGAGFLRYLAVCGILEEHGGTYRISRRGTMLTGDIALARLGFYLEAYGPVISSAARLLDGSTVPRAVRSNDRYVVTSSTDVFPTHGHPPRPQRSISRCSLPTLQHGPHYTHVLSSLSRKWTLT